MLVEILLASWSGVGLVWWILSLSLVLFGRRPVTTVPHQSPKKSLSIFKPLSPLENGDLQIVTRGLESFISQLDEASELLLGVHEIDWPHVSPFFEKMQALYPQSRIVIIRRSESDTLANPKIAWQKFMAPQATGDLWLWSDSDIIVPPEFLNSARAEFETCGAGMLTFPYAVRAIPSVPDVLDALFVNAEIYPGVLLLRKFGTVDFGLGAAMLFTRESFQEKVFWEKIGAALADDFVLGQALQPVQLSKTTIETVAHVANWSSAFEHYFRWKKTVCWCRPFGFAAQAIAMPVLGWLGFVLLHPFDDWAWTGFIATMQMDVIFAALICRTVGCRLSFTALLAAETWSLWRVLFWVACWLPGRVKWSKRSWRGAHEVSYAP
jgi:ceramide glucosyltransferase